MNDQTDLILKPISTSNQIDNLVENPYAAQVTLQLAMNTYKKLTRPGSSYDELPAALRDTLENLAKFKQQIGDHSDMDLFRKEQERSDLSQSSCSFQESDSKDDIVIEMDI